MDPVSDDDQRIGIKSNEQSTRTMASSVEEGLTILSQKTEEFTEGIIPKLRNDPWGHPYEYVVPGRSEAFEIISYGADHREGGSGADKDIRSDELE